MNKVEFYIIAIYFTVLLSIIFWLFELIKETLKRNVFFKNQYEEQKKYTDRNIIITTSASKEKIFESLEKEIKIDDSPKWVIKGRSI